MTLDLPKPVAAYFTADKVDSEAVARVLHGKCRREGRGAHLPRPGRDQASGRRMPRPSTSTRASRSRANRRTARSSSPAGSPATFPAAPSIFGSSSNSKATRSRRWKSSRDQGIAAKHTRMHRLTTAARTPSNKESGNIAGRIAGSARSPTGATEESGHAEHARRSSFPRRWAA